MGYFQEPEKKKPNTKLEKSKKEISQDSIPQTISPKRGSSQKLLNQEPHHVQSSSLMGEFKEESNTRSSITRSINWGVPHDEFTSQWVPSSWVPLKKNSSIQEEVLQEKPEQVEKKSSHLKLERPYFPVRLKIMNKKIGAGHFQKANRSHNGERERIQWMQRKKKESFHDRMEEKKISRNNHSLNQTPFI